MYSLSVVILYLQWCQGVVLGTNDHSSLVVRREECFPGGGARGQKWTGHVNVLPQCSVHPEGDEYLFTRSFHIGTQKAGANPCQINTE